MSKIRFCSRYAAFNSCSVRAILISSPLIILLISMVFSYTLFSNDFISKIDNPVCRDISGFNPVNPFFPFPVHRFCEYLFLIICCHCNPCIKRSIIQLLFLPVVFPASFPPFICIRILCWR